MPANQPLSTYQRRVLWHLSQGLTVSETARTIGTPRQSVTDSSALARRKLGASTNIQAVLLAYLAGEIGTHLDCGARRSYVRHLGRDEDPCPACKRANTAWIEAQSRPVSPPEPLTEAEVRLLRALHVGRTHLQLQQLWGVSRSVLHRAISELYRKLRVDGEVREIRRERAIAAGLELGYLHRDVPPAAQVRLPPSARPLTEREQETLRAVNGRSLTEASAVLGIPSTSVSSRLHLIYTKIGVHHLPRRDKRATALDLARQQGYRV